ncbi:hypothetical protein SRHO_G00099000 [Serrasalmus rhombeus]
MSAYLWTVILLLASCAGSLSAQSRIFISVRMGSSAVLPCHWRNITSTQSATHSPHVEWRTFAETVFERRGEELYQGEGYKDRVDVPEDNLLKGDCSLELKNVRPEDEGVYESFLLVRRTKRSLRSKRVFLQSVQLSIDDKLVEIHTESKAAERIQESNAGIIHTSSQITMFILVTNILFHLI